MNENHGKQSKIRRILGWSLFALACIAILWFCWEKLVRFLQDPEIFTRWTQQYGIWAEIIFVLLVITQVILAFIPAGPFQIAAGIAWGAVKGSALCILGSCLGSMLVFALVHRYGVEFTHRVVSEKDHEKIDRLRTNPKVEAIIAIVYFIPGTPKDILAYTAGFTGIHWWQWLLVCTLGRLPGIILSNLSGNAFVEGNLGKAGLILLILAVLGGGGALVYHKASEHRDKNAK